MPIRLGYQVLGLLDLHSRRSALRTPPGARCGRKRWPSSWALPPNARLYGEAAAPRCG
ncbi:MAG: hypothetical protein U0401_14065 [Anaerolineae bacterium]